MNDGYEVTTSSDPAVFVERAGGFLRRSPVEHSVLLTRSAQALEESAAVRATQLWCWVQDARGGVVAAAMETPPHVLAVSLAPPDAVRALAAQLAVRRPDLPGVSGPHETATVFAERWSELTGADARVRMQQGVYRAHDITPPAGVEGRPRPAEVHDAALLRSWAAEFERETGSVATGRDHVDWRIDRGLLHVWDVGGDPVCMTAATAAHGGVSRVQVVFTPVDQRGRGWASALVASVSRTVLGRGDTPMLYTDLANPVSNSIYQRIGYVRVGTSVMLGLRRRRSPGQGGGAALG